MWETVLHKEGITGNLKEPKILDFTINIQQERLVKQGV